MDKISFEPGKKRELIPVALINRKKMEMSPIQKIKNLCL
jgi:hypothetical protein